MSRRRTGQWLPWSEFARMGEDLSVQGQRAHAARGGHRGLRHAWIGRSGGWRTIGRGPATLTGVIIAATVASSVAWPGWTTPLSIVGGLLVVAVILLATGELRRLRKELHAAGWPSPLDLARVSWRHSRHDLRRLLYGGAHHDDRMHK